MKRTLLTVLFLVFGALPASGGGIQCHPVPQPKPQPGGQFGCSVNLHDGTLAVGAHLDGAGSVTLCPQGATETADCQKISPADGHPGDEFGRSVAVDEKWVIVGAPFANGSGAVYVYNRDLALNQKLTASDGARGDQLGATLALSNSDTLIVGALNNAGTTGSLSGAVYVFHWDGQSWKQGQKLTADDARAFDNFGFSLAIDGNVIVVGAPFHEGVGANSGEAYVFEWNGKTWSQTARLTASDGAADDEFGSAVSVSGSALVVGARADDVNGMPDAGSAYVYEKSRGGWRETHLFGEAAGDRFGVAASMSGDRLVIGAMLHDGGTGAVYLFVRQTDGTWVRAGDPVPGDASGGRFGQSVSIDGQNFLGGAYLANNGAGSACVCPFPVREHSADLGLTLSGPASIRPGQTITYTLTVTNHGPNKATGVRLEEPIPAGLQPVRSLLPENCTITGGKIACALPDLPSGSPPYPVLLRFTVLETCATAIMSQQAIVSASEKDPNPDNDKAPPLSTAVVRKADLRIAKTAPAVVQPEASIAYGLTVTNLGPDVACEVVVSDPIPPRLSSPVATPPCEVMATEVRCPLGVLPVGPASLLTVTFKAPEVGVGGLEILNTATVQAAPPTADRQPANDSETVKTLVLPVPPPPPPIPTLTEPWLATLALLLALLALRRLRRRAL